MTDDFSDRIFFGDKVRGVNKKYGKTDWTPCIELGCINMVPFSERDEKFYREQGWVDRAGNVIRPKRCKGCREKRKNLNK